MSLGIIRAKGGLGKVFWAFTSALNMHENVKMGVPFVSLASAVQVPPKSVI